MALRIKIENDQGAVAEYWKLTGHSYTYSNGYQKIFAAGWGPRRTLRS